jgi:2-polyprenyl-3-methyl-5-hydroxy-6-metoxy-1,4-benzoquinol methylase
VDAHIVGIDVSRDGLERNTLVHEKILGDIQTFPLPPESFDAIVCWDVLEHLPRPESAFANLAQALKPGGRLTIGVPNFLSPKALITKVTPHWFHVWFYRYVFKFRHAGEPGHGPWPTHLRWSIRPSGLRKLALEHDLRIEEIKLYSADSLEEFWSRHPVCSFIYDHCWPGNPRLTECEAIFAKPSRN